MNGVNGLTRCLPAMHGSCCVQRAAVVKFDGWLAAVLGVAGQRVFSLTQRFKTKISTIKAGCFARFKNVSVLSFA